MKIVTVLGARPQFIKASVVSQALRTRPLLSEVVIHTGQHFDANMSAVFFDDLAMAPPNHHLGIHGGRHGEMTGRMLTEIERVLLDEQPAAVLVYGDTNSTLAGALAAAKLHIPVAHVEAGLRSFNRRMPEEINRILTDRVSQWLFAPTRVAADNLAREGVDPAQIDQVGDVMYDVALAHGARVDPQGGPLGQLGLEAAAYVLATAHRAENTDDPVRLQAIALGLLQVAATLPVVWPVHPRALAALRSLGLPTASGRGLHMIEPAGYLEMIQLEKYAAAIATDSGGVQKEAFFHRVPCVTLRTETEWTELVDAGWNRLAAPESPQRVADAVLRAIGTRGAEVQPYGAGDAAQRIAQRLAADLGT